MKMAVVYGHLLFTTGLRKRCLLAIINVEPLERNEIYDGLSTIVYFASRCNFLIIIVRRCRNGELGIVLLNFQRLVQVVVSIHSKGKSSAKERPKCSLAINIARHGSSLLVDFVLPCPSLRLDVVRPCPSMRLDFD